VAAAGHSVAIDQGEPVFAIYTEALDNPETYEPDIARCFPGRELAFGPWQADPTGE
jgi:hypothetical protein